MQGAEILKLVAGNNKLPLDLVAEKRQATPASVQYHIRRYVKTPQTDFEDSGVITYYYQKADNKDNCLQLKFCVAGNTYCTDIDCRNCRMGNCKNCSDSTDSIDLVQIHFSPVQLSQFIKSKTTNGFSDDVLNFRHRVSFSKTLPVCTKIKNVIDGIVNHPYSGSLENIFINAQLHMLLLFSLDCIGNDTSSALPECKFLSNVADVSKVAQARELLMQHIGEPITIKELSRKVAMNECYLKKGFKEMYGTTIFDFYQNQRMQHAKYLLYEKGMSVTDVSVMLGYSSISHFSTAFKKFTGLKPCELLLR